jgi:hypothetical protein
MRALSALAVSVVLLAQLSPVAAGVLLCIAEGAASDCCPRQQVQSELDDARRILEGSACVCCVLVHAAPSRASASVAKPSSEIDPDPVSHGSVAAPAATQLPRPLTASGGDARLSSLRTVILLI